MELHTFIGSPNSHKVEAVIDHLGLEVELVYQDFLAGDLRTAGYLALNPNAMVPTLVDGGFKLWESNAITQYLADKAGDQLLLPRDPRQRAEVLRWQFWELAHFNRAFGTLVFDGVIRPRLNLGASNPALVAKGQADLTRFAPVLEAHLAKRDYLVGDGITIADYAILALETYRDAVAFDWKPYGRINAYFDRLRETPSWVRTAAKDLSLVGRKPRAA
ncbi:MAG TPA: glutathione S-transferase family protein [Dongiaceae bacterium]|nr:glutathione S-transferase family protein [Dongiaceae bacterium]